MVINGKQYLRAFNYGNTPIYVLLNEEAEKPEDKIIRVSFADIEADIENEVLKEIDENSTDFKEEVKKRTKKVKRSIEKVIFKYDPFLRYGLNKIKYLKGVYYFNLFKNTEIREKMLKIRKETKDRYTNLDFIKKFPHVDLLLDNLSNFKKEQKEYLVNWLAFVFITHKKTMNTIIFKTVEGAGKGLLKDYIVSKVFKNVVEIGNAELQSDFNGFLEQKSFLIANEIQDYTNKKSVYEKLKQWITDKNVLLNIKHRNHITVDNFLNILIFSNNETPVPLTITDRRYSVIRTETKLENLVKEKMGITIKQFVENYKKETESFLYELAKYDFDEDKAIALLENKERQTLINNTEEKWKIIRRKLLERDKNYFLNDYKNEAFHFIDDSDEYFEITKKLKLGNINDNIDQTHEQIIGEIFEALELKDFVPNNYLRYLLYFIYGGKYEITEIKKFVAKLGEKVSNVWFKNTNNRGIRFENTKINKLNNNYNKNEEIVQLTKEEYIELLNRIKELEKENEELKQQIPF